MTHRNLIRAAIVSAAVLSALPAAAACKTGRCEDGARTTASKPLKLDNHRRKPVALSATRTVKKKNGEYAKAAIKTRTKPRPAQAAPEALSPEAALAFASYELARVRVLTPDELDGANLSTDAPDTRETTGAAVSVDNVQVVSAEEVNFIDRGADSPRAVSLDALARGLAANTEPKAEGESWLSRLLMVLGGAFAAVAALVRTLLG